MSLVNELLDDLQQQQSSKSMPLNIPLSVGAPKGKKKSYSYVKFFLVAVIFLIVTLLIFFQAEKWFGINNKIEIESNNSQKVPEKIINTQVFEANEVDQALSDKATSREEPVSSVPLVHVKFTVSKHEVTLWIQSQSRLDMSMLVLMPSQQQLLIKKEVRIDSQELALPEVKWLKMDARYAVGQTLIWFTSPFPLSLKLEAEKQKMGWFHYVVAIKVNKKVSASYIQTLQSKKMKTSPASNKRIAPVKNMELNSVAGYKKQLLVPAVVEANLTASVIQNHSAIGKTDQDLLEALHSLQRKGLLEQAYEMAEKALIDQVKLSDEHDLIKSRLWFLKKMLKLQNWNTFNTILHDGFLLNPDNPSLVKLAVRAKLKQNDLHGAWALLSQRPTEAGSDVEYMHLLASTAYRIKDYNAAYMYYHRLIKIEPDNALNFVGLGRTLEALSKFDKALVSYEFAFQLGLSKARVNKFVIERIQQLKNSIK